MGSFIDWTLSGTTPHFQPASCSSQGQTSAILARRIPESSLSLSLPYPNIACHFLQLITYLHCNLVQIIEFYAVVSYIDKWGLFQQRLSAPAGLNHSVVQMTCYTVSSVTI